MHQHLAQSQVYKLQPALLESLLGLGNAAAAGLEASLVHLVKLRASQINGCAYCQHMHANEARKDGERQERLDVLPAWREVAAFSERERAALRWAEHVTRIADAGERDPYVEVAAHFSEKEIVDLTAILVTINAWNRIAVSFHFAPDFKP